ncbi:MAG: sigma-70 family RNA polymerase sigma factor [Candidatus Rifleibacteriota bacterium]
MYCFEAHKCTKYDCPVQRHQIKRCWVFLKGYYNKEITTEECPFAPCDQCNYRLGWEIGLIGESLFPDNPDPTPESLIPPPEAPKERTKTTEEKKEPDKEPVSPEEEKKTEVDNYIEEKKLRGIGKPGLRFCHEIVECPNPNCVVRRRQIIQCFKFFSRKTAEEKQDLTCTERTCDSCFYKKGWDIGILDESLFKDILEAKKLRLAKADRIKRNTLVEIYLNELKKKPLTREEEIELAKKIAGDKEASELFLLANLKLVTRIAKRYSNKGLGIMDLIQEGNIGLIKSIAKFDFTLGYRFSTYAAYWIRYYMQRAVAHQGTTIRIPYHLLTVSHKIRKKIQEYEYAHYKSPTLRELARLMGLEEEKIISVIQITQSPISINASTGDGNQDETIEYYLSDKKTLTPEELAIENLKNQAVEKAIENLPTRLQYVINNYYGFVDEELNLAEIGRRLGISRERSRQLLRQALQKLEQDEFIKTIE